MSEHLTAEQEAEIRNREGSATPGPWGVYFDGVVYDVASQIKLTSTGFQCRRAIARLDDEPIDNDPAHRDWTAEQDAVQVYHDATFVARSRSDVPALLTEVDRLRAELAATRRAKAENDERFQIAAAEQRDRAEKAEAALTASPQEEYPGELAHLRDLLRAVGRLADTQPEGNPLTELLIDHYSDSRIADAQLAKGGTS
ncbi:hypothetical protein [Streptomyces sp. NPDC054887]